MFKSLKKVLVGVLASSLVLSSVVFAAGSATDAPAAKEFSKAAKKATVTVAKDVTVVNAGAFNKKNVNVKFASKKKVTVKRNAFKNAKKLKTITVYKNKVDCQHFFRQIFLGYFSDIVQAFDTLRKNVCGDDYTSLHNPIVLSSVLPAYGMFHSIQILFL